MSDFVSLYTALSGLRAAETAMDVSSHNVANVATPGYTRQRFGLATRQPYDSPFGLVGAGVDVADIARARDAFLDARAQAGLANTKLQSIAERLQRARELAVRGATFTSADERNGIAVEVAGLRDEILALANSRHGGRGLFSGYAVDGAVTNVAGVWTYTGDAGQVNRRVGDTEVVAVNVTAADVLGFASGTDVFSILDGLEAALVADDTAGIEGSITAVDGALDGVLRGLTTLGGAANRIESASYRNAGDVLELQGRLSMVEGVDLSEAVMELQLRETAYQAALVAFSQTSQPSLVDFIA